MQADSVEPPEDPRNGSDALVSLLSAIVDSSDDAIVSKTLDGAITSWNDAAVRMFGYGADEIIGKSIRLIIPKELQAEEDYVLSMIRRGERVDHFETVRQTKDGQRKEVSLTVSPIRDGAGNVVGASKIARDITEKKRMERERETLLAREKVTRLQLAEAVAARDEFIAVAAHELRNPLNVLILTFQLQQRLLGKSDVSGALSTLVQRARSQVIRLSALVDRLLDVTRIREGIFDLYPETFALSDLLVEVAGRLTTEHSLHLISLSLESNIEGTWDRLRLDQAFTNLLSNALKYGGNKPVEVKASMGDDHVFIEVRDQGVGIAPQDLGRVFDRFVRIAGNSQTGGLGIGLWITKQIVEAHRGTIRVESQPGKGSTFVVRLPLNDRVGAL